MKSSTCWWQNELWHGASIQQVMNGLLCSSLIQPYILYLEAFYSSVWITRLSPTFFPSVCDSLSSFIIVCYLQAMLLIGTSCVDCFVLATFKHSETFWHFVKIQAEGAEESHCRSTIPLLKICFLKSVLSCLRSGWLDSWFETCKIVTKYWE